MDGGTGRLRFVCRPLGGGDRADGQGCFALMQRRHLCVPSCSFVVLAFALHRPQRTRRYTGTAHARVAYAVFPSRLTQPPEAEERSIACRILCTASASLKSEIGRAHV